MFFRLSKKLRCCLAVVTWSFSAGVAQGEAAIVPPSEEMVQELSRVRISATYFSFSLDGNAFSGYGPDAIFERAISPNWCLGAGFSQAYTLDGKFTTLFTSIDISAWYSVTGHFVREKRSYRDRGSAIAEFTGNRTGGLRIGLGTQQYFFNTSKAAVPFSGLSFKAQYEFGLNRDYDLAIGADSASLANADTTAKALKFYASILYPL